MRDRDDGSRWPCRLLVPAPHPGLRPLGLRATHRSSGRGEERKIEERMRGERLRGESARARRAAASGGREMIRVRVGWGDGRRRALYSPPPNGQIAPQRADPTVEGARGEDGAGPDGPPSCQTGRGRASPCWALSRAVPVLVPRAEIAAQARPGLWHGHEHGPAG